MATSKLLSVIRLFAILSILILMASCGGGGGGSDSSENPSNVDVSGRVLDSNGTPVPGATVTFESNSVVVTTDDLGNFTAKVPPGKHTLTVSMGNVTFYQNTLTVNDGSPVSLGDLSPTTPYNYESSGYSISGTVTVSGGGALQGVTITLSGTGSGTVTTDASGNYTFSGLSNGSYTFTPSKSGYTFSPSSKAVTISEANSPGNNFTATAIGPDRLLGSWILSDSHSPFPGYLIADGYGNITDFGAFETQGTGYNAITNDHYQLHALSSGVFVNLDVYFTSSTHATTSASINGGIITGTLDKVSDLSICSGTWAGTLTPNPIYSLTIGSDGAIGSSNTGFTSPVSGHFFCIGTDVTGFIRTGSSGGYEQIKIKGTLSGNSIVGFFRNNNMVEGPVQLTK
jgi:hypothetical protein